jgi:two-component system NtrC family sensor kinase
MSEHTILCVDDEENILRTLKRVFIEEDWTLLTAISGEEGLGILKESDVHLIIADYRMPGMTGVEFLKHAKEINNDAIRIVLSGYADVDAISTAVNEGEIYKFISKPWNDDDLRVTVRRSLEQHDLVRENRNLYEKITVQNEELRTLNENLEEKIRERTAELELRNYALRLAQDVIEYMPIGILGISMEGEVALVNAEMLSLFGLAGKPLLGSKLEGYLPEAIQEMAKKSSRSGQRQERWGYRHGDMLLHVRTSLMADSACPKGIIVIAQRQHAEA